MKRVVAGMVLVAAMGCGGETPSPFRTAVYVEITSSLTLNPSSLPAPNGARVIFINHHSSAHTVNWTGQVTYNSNVQPGDRTWLDLPSAPDGTVFNFHLDASGPSGSVTVFNIGP